MKDLYLLLWNKSLKYVGNCFWISISEVLINGIVWLLFGNPLKSNWLTATYSGFAAFTSRVIEFSVDSIIWVLEIVFTDLQFIKRPKAHKNRSL